MKIFPLGFFVMALLNVIEAKQSDIGRPIYIGQEKETNKSQLDMLIAQIRQLKEEGTHQRIQTKEQELKNEELQLQLQDQQLQLQQEIKERRKETKERRREIKEKWQEQQHNNNKLLEEIKELTKINRARRSENETEHLLELIRAEINHVAGLSQCEVGTEDFNFGSGKTEDTKTIFFERKFTRTPKVATSLYVFWGQKGVWEYGWYGCQALASSPTTTKFDLSMRKYSLYRFSVSWIACA